MVRAETVFTIRELKTEKSAEVKPAKTPRNKPSLYSKSNEKMIYNPSSTTRPSSTSYFLICVLLNHGSSNAAQSELVAKPTRLTDTFETLAEPKNAIQWKETIKPMAISL